MNVSPVVRRIFNTARRCVSRVSIPEKVERAFAWVVVKRRRVSRAVVRGV
jgi:hypothetical protein